MQGAGGWQMLMGRLCMRMTAPEQLFLASGAAEYAGVRPNATPCWRANPCTVALSLTGIASDVRWRATTYRRST